MMVRYTATIAISTPKDHLNYATRLALVCDPKTKKLYFLTISFGYSCSACSLNPSLDNPCTHIYRKPPNHKGISNEDMARNLLGDGGEAETEGIAAADDELMFIKHLNAFASTPKLTSFNASMQIIYSYIDPEGGGERSLFSISTIGRDGHKFVYLGAESYQNKQQGEDNDKKLALLTLHYSRLFALPDQFFSRQGIIAIAIESQGDHDKPHIYRDHLFATLPNYRHRFFFYRLREKVPNQIGVLVDAKIKEAWTNYYVDKLSHGQLYILADQFFVSKDLKATMNHFWDQFSRYAKSIIKVANPQFQEAKTFRYGAKQGGLFDDVITTKLGAIYMAIISINLRYFKGYLAQNNITRW